ncbi:Flavonoid 3',5'-hydroxylase 1 [Camellia lanceoleosa]|uniref:Flavonoid 3',5'-hydroxylase 1 n=1 Tax=Camellia lanceoleosa TaxID=1840588 RepID=A0ACC0G1X2_9ERIC|nr:Flavonoid 3',5'-hydroxylase 1 [Camellia lanceoleosa]
MVVGGTDTTSNTVEFALAEMMNKPQVLRKAQPEIETVVGKDNIVEELHIHKLPYLYAFDPERFLKESKWDCCGNDFNYFPFGSRRRICAGTAMAERMFMFSLASLVHSFDWKLPEGEKLDLEEKFGIMLKKKVPLVAIPTPRLSDLALYE